MLHLKHPVLHTKQKRLVVMTGCVVVLGFWSVCLPPLPVEPVHLPPDIDMNIHPDSMVDMTITDLSVWDIPVLKPATGKPVIKVEKPVQKPVVKTALQPVVTYQPPVQQEPSTPPVRLPQIKYLGQVTDQTGLQVFLSFEDENVMMRMNQVYGQTWQIVAVNDQQVRVLHVPFQQIINVMK